MTRNAADTMNGATLYINLTAEQVKHVQKGQIETPKKTRRLIEVVQQEAGYFEARTITGAIKHELRDGLFTVHLRPRRKDIETHRPEETDKVVSLLPR
jgi:hypothetical protein